MPAGRPDENTDDRNDAMAALRDDTSHERGRDADSPTDLPKEAWKDVAKRVKEQGTRTQTPLLASGVAFWLFLSLFPTLIAAVTVFGLFLDPDEVAERVENLLEAMPAEAQTLIANQLENIAGAGGTALGVGLLLSLGAAVWSASAAMYNLMRATNSIYHEHDDRGFIKKRGLALLLTLGAIVFGGIVLAAVAAVPPLLRAAGLPGALSLLVWPLLLVLFAVGLAVVYRYAPDREDAEWRWVTPGAIAAVVVWGVGSIAFQLYVANFGDYQETYGALAAVVILLLWLMLTALSVLLGAHVNAELEAQTSRDSTTGPDRRPGDRGAYVADHLGRARGEIEGARRRAVDLREDETTHTDERVR